MCWGRTKEPLQIRNILHTVSHIFRIENLGDQLQIANSLANGYCELMRVDDTAEIMAGLQPLLSDRKQILVLAE